MARLSVFRSRFFWNLFLTYSILIVATTAVIGILTDRQISASLDRDVEDRLRVEVELLEPLCDRAFSGAKPEEIQREVEILGRRSRTRVTLILPDGTVLADSEEKPSVMENHGQREEVLESFTEPYGVARRVSRTTGTALVYVARVSRDPEGRQRGTARVSIPVKNVEERLAAIRYLLIGGACFGGLFALLLGFFVTRKITAPVAEMTEVAEAIRHGGYHARVRRLPKSELGDLGETLNRLCAELTERIAAMSRDRTQFQAMLAGMVEGVLAVDARDTVLFCNQAACKLLGAGSPDSFIGHVLRVSNEELHGLIDEVRSEGSSGQREITVHRGAQETILDAHATPFAGEDTEGVVVLLHDVSSLRRLEGIRRDFVANVSHELKTPLTAIKGFVETLLSGAIHDDRNNLRFLKKIQKNVDRLSHLVVDLLTLARIEAEEHTLPRKTVDWKPLIHETMRRYETAIHDKKLSCTVDLSDRPVLVHGDPDDMSQVLDNLLDNAIKYTPEGGSVNLRVSIENGDGVLVVSDTGIGIPERDLEHVFERFYRVDKARSRELGGTGLGLSIVKHLVNSMSGEVRVRSVVGEGTTFRVSIPRAQGG